MPSKRKTGESPLDVFFRPTNVAVIGATEKPASVGRAIVANLVEGGFPGAIYPVNPKHPKVLGLTSYPELASIPEDVALAVIVTPALTVPGIVKQCADAGVEGAIIISAGFRETGDSGKLLEQEVLREARRRDVRIIGPNCLGLMNPHAHLNATFASSIARPGHLGLISQSGAICTAILDWSQRENVGFSAFVSVGSMLDVGWGDLIQYLGDDPRTRTIIIYMESIGDAGEFLSAAREVALSKPIIVLKPGRTEAAAKAAASHTGALTGQDDVLDAAFRRCGVLRVDTIAELFNLSEALDKQPRPRGPKLTIVTNAGGAAVLATDALLGAGGQLATLSAETIRKLDEFLPPHWSHQNPIDILGDASAERYAQAVSLAAEDPSTDGLLVVLAPQAMTDPAAVAEKLAPFAQLSDKPVIASWMGGQGVAAGEAALNRARIPTYSYPDSAARVFQTMWRYSANLESLYETPEAFESEDPKAAGNAEARLRASESVAKARAKRRTLLTEAESKGLLAAYGIPTVETVIATDAEQALEIARRIGYPVVLKLHSETVTHKTDVGGVQLNLVDDAAVRNAYQSILDSVTHAAGPEHFLGVTVQPMVRADGYELILGSSIDPQFGPVLLFGGGGQLVEVYKDRAIGLPPLNTTLARRLMERTMIFRALRGVRGREPVDLAALERLLVRFSYLVVEQKWIQEIDINPLLAGPGQLLALDARVVLHPRETVYPPEPAIRPYPEQYSRPWRFEDGQEVLIRPIRPEDEPLMVRFHGRLSERSVYLRYFHLVNLAARVSHQRLVRICFNDYNREIALIVERRDPATREPEILAVGRLAKAHAVDEAELAVLIADDYQGHGLGTELWRRLVEIARAEKLDRVTAEILPENFQMIEICRLLGFRLEPDEDVLHAVLDLSAQPDTQLV
jgi:acetyltransferase